MRQQYKNFYAFCTLSLVDIFILNAIATLTSIIFLFLLKIKKKKILSCQIL